MAPLHADFIKADLAHGLSFVGYASFTVAFVLGILALVKPDAPSHERGSFWARFIGSPALKPEKRNRQWLRFGFLMLTCGLITGIIGATFAGDDPLAQGPEGNLGLVTWLIYGGVLHLHYLPEFKGRKALWASVLAWGLVLFTYCGVGNLPIRSQSGHLPPEPRSRVDPRP